MIPEPVYDDDGEYQPQPWDRPLFDGGTELETEDPRAFSHDLAGIAMTLSAAWEKGILPAQGSLLDQPARAMALIRVWNRCVGICEDVKMKRVTV